MPTLNVLGCSFYTTSSKTSSSGYGCTSPHTLSFTHSPIHGPTKSWHLLVNFLLALAKGIIYQTRKEALVRGNLGDCGSIYLSFLCTHLWTEFHWGTCTDALDTFKEQWVLGGVLCSGSPLRIFVINMITTPIPVFSFIAPSNQLLCFYRPFWLRTSLVVLLVGLGPLSFCITNTPTSKHGRSASFRGRALNQYI